MKKFIIAALAATIVAGPVLAQPYQGQDNRGRQSQGYDHRNDRRADNRNDHRNDRRADYRRWNRGERFDYRQARNYRVIGNPGIYHLRPAPRGYRWVQSGNDAVMIGIATGLVASVLAGAFN